jgi:hypothetical protein
MIVALITIFSIGIVTILILAGIGMQGKPNYLIMEGYVLVKCECDESIYVDYNKVAVCPKCGKKYELTMAVRQVNQ